MGIKTMFLKFQVKQLYLKDQEAQRISRDCAYSIDKITEKHPDLKDYLWELMGRER